MPRKCTGAFAPKTFAAAAIIALGVGAAPVIAQDAAPAAKAKCTPSDIALMKSKAAPMAEGDKKSKAMSELMRAENAWKARDRATCTEHVRSAEAAMAPAT